MRKGFTLAEVLITLGIIGVVASMTLPALVAKHRKKVLHTQFLKTYSDIQNAAKRFQADEGITVYEYSKGESGSISTNTLIAFIKYFIGQKNGGLVSSNDPDTGENVSYKNAIGYIPKNLANKFFSTSQPCDKSIISEEIGGRFFAMDDPVSRYNDPPYGPKICVDINGRKGPNQYGYDWFVFVFTKDGGVKPYIGSGIFDITGEMPNPELACSYSFAHVTYTCAYFAVTNTSPEDPTKSYWNDFLK